MDFRSYLSSFALCICSLVTATSINAAEWKIEPTVNFRTQYNDNVRMRSEENGPEGSSGLKARSRGYGMWRLMPV